MNPDSAPSSEQENVDLRERLSEAEKKNLELQAKVEGLEKENAELKLLADRDSLTGLYNRRGFIEHMKLETSLAKRVPGRFLGLLLIDVNLFKEVNDSFGHPTGDDALRLVADAITKGVRDSDLVCRLGGDEFAVILREPLDATVPQLVANRMAEILAGKPLVKDGQDIPVSISIGGSAATGEDVASLYEKSDKNLYAAKKQKTATTNPIICG